MGRSPKSKKSLADKVRDIDAQFADEAPLMTAEALKEKLVSIARYDEEMDEAKKNDQDLAEKKAVYDAAKESYTEPIKANKLRRKYILETLASRGQ